MLTTLPLMSLCLAVAAMFFINGVHLVPIVVFVYRTPSSIQSDAEIAEEQPH